MKTYHITFYVSREVESDTGVLLSGITIEANDVEQALKNYKARMKSDSLPLITEIKYILEV
jgi:hypothetical protein